MKRLLILAALCAAPQAHSLERQEILRLQNPTSPEHRRATLMRLELDGKTLFCATPNSPRHPIRVRGLHGLQPPATATAAAMPLDCPDIIRWGKRSYCYRKHENPVLDQVLRQCAGS